MFSGIVEGTGTLLSSKPAGTGLEFQFSCSFLNELKIDQSISHNGVCLTVAGIHEDAYSVIAIHETLRKTNLGSLAQSDLVNLERSVTPSTRLDGHIVQGHVDTRAKCLSIIDLDGSWLVRFKAELMDPARGMCTIPRGSVTLNGVSLTVAEQDADEFTVAIIPYTFHHTNFKALNPGDFVNLEYDVLGKYIAALLPHRT